VKSHSIAGCRRSKYLAGPRAGATSAKVNSQVFRGDALVKLVAGVDIRHFYNSKARVASKSETALGLPS